MSKKTHTLEILRNAEGGKLAYINGNTRNECGFRIAGPKGWGGTSKITGIEMDDSALIHYVTSRCYGHDLAKQLRSHYCTMKPVSEPPKKALTVLVKTNDGRWQEWCYTKQSGFPLWAAHWMPLPEVLK